MNSAEEEADIVRLLQGGSINALVFNETELNAVDRLVNRGQVVKDYRGPLGMLGVPYISLSR